MPADPSEALAAIGYPGPSVYPPPDSFVVEPAMSPIRLRNGDFVKVRRGNVHIVAVHWNGVETVCGGWYPTDLVSPASGDEPKQCATCWERM